MPTPYTPTAVWPDTITLPEDFVDFRNSASVNPAFSALADREQWLYGNLPAERLEAMYESNSSGTGCVTIITSCNVGDWSFPPTILTGPAGVLPAIPVLTIHPTETGEVLRFSVVAHGYLGIDPLAAVQECMHEIRLVYSTDSWASYAPVASVIARLRLRQIGLYLDWIPVLQGYLGTFALPHNQIAFGIQQNIVVLGGTAPAVPTDIMDDIAVRIEHFRRPA